MTGLHDEVNERLELRVVPDIAESFRPELAAFLAGLGAGHLLEEVFLPLGATARTRTAVAYEERPWPPAGVGARALRGVALAVLGDDGQGLLTPVMLSPQYATNVGLASALTKILFEDLIDAGVESVSVFVNERSKLVAGELANAGFAPRQARVVTGQTQFVAHAAHPAEALRALGIADVRTGDVLALNLDRQRVTQLAALQLSLVSGVANYWSDRVQWAEVFPGFIDWAALPPGGIGGTPGPHVEPVDQVIVIPE